MKKPTVKNSASTRAIFILPDLGSPDARKSAGAVPNGKSGGFPGNPPAAAVATQRLPMSAFEQECPPADESAGHWHAYCLSLIRMFGRAR